MSILIAIPAAGSSQRMRGRDKLLEDIDGVPLLRRQAGAAISSGHPVLTLLRPEDAKRTMALEGLNVTIIPVPDAPTGMSASLRLAAKSARGHTGLAILLPDVPGVGSTEIKAVLDAFEASGGQTVTRATDPTGRPGTPIVFPPHLLPSFQALTGDDGGRRLLQHEDINHVAFPDDRATRDLDTPEDWADWRRVT